jgi:hypothetical protein
VMPAVVPTVEAAYERAMIGEVAALCRHIPHGDLCIQWDVCNEMVMWDGQPTNAVPGDEPHENIVAPCGACARQFPAMSSSACIFVTAISAPGISSSLRMRQKWSNSPTR